jgi:hypothetical protein
VLFRSGSFHALEVEAGFQFAVGLVHGIGQLVAVYLGNAVEGGHGGILVWAEAEVYQGVLGVAAGFLLRFNGFVNAPTVRDGAQDRTGK